MSAEILKERLEGVHVYPVTPFTPDLELDEDGLRKNIHWLLESGIRHFTPLGSTGEFSNLSLDEHRRVIELVLEVTKGENVVVTPGCASNSTRVLVDMAHWCEDSGVDGVLIPPPTYFPNNVEVVTAHLMAVNDSVDIGILFYYLPSWHHFDVSHEEFVGLLRDVPNLVGLKDAGDDMILTERYLRELGDKLVCIGGGGEFTAPYTYMVGGKGIVSLFANFWPELPLRMHRAGIAGDYEGVLGILREVGDFLDFMYTNQSTLLIKRAMELRGLTGGPVRLPLLDRVTPEQDANLRGYLETYGLL